MVTALLLLHALKQDIRFEHPVDKSITYNWWEVLLLPYTLNFKRESDRGRTPQGDVELQVHTTEQHEVHQDAEDGRCNGEAVLGDEILTPISSAHHMTGCHPSSIRIVVVMSHESGLRSWPFYEISLDILSGALYFYGTMVWLSVVFFGSTTAMLYVGMTVGVYVAIRLINGIF
jgi:hypothetical protein